MVDEDHSGEISAVVLEHFLDGVVDDTRGDKAAGLARGKGNSLGGEVERYLQGALDPRLTAREIVAEMTGGKEQTTFEAVKRFLLQGSATLAGCERVSEAANSS